MSELHPISGCDNPSRRADVIFAHGLGGDWEKTWRWGKDSDSSWPHWLGADVPDIGVWSLGYAASPTSLIGLRSFFGGGHSMAIPDRANEVLDRMSLRGFGARPIVFVCHSLGGLVVKSLLRRSADISDPSKHAIYEQTRGVMFLATPHAGSDLATVLGAFQLALSTTISVEDLRADDANLADLFDWYVGHSQNIRTITYFEQHRMGGKFVVNRTSARSGCGADPVGVEADHLGIAKPEQPDASVCLSLKALINDCVSEDFFERLHPTSNRAVPAKPVRIPCELPPSAENFFGRAKDLARLTERLRAGKNSAVVGAAGMGKTALAAEALIAVVGAQGRDLAASPFSDGVVYLDLYRLKGEDDSAWHELANKVAGVLFMDRSKPLDRATAALAGKRILVVVEGAEESADVDRLLSVLPPEARRLVLTRNRAQLIPGASIVLDDALSPEDAGALFDALTDGRVSGAARRETLELLEGHPLALTWAGGLLGRGDESPRDLVNDWRKQTLPALADPMESTHTLEWLFKKSASGLSDDAKVLLAGAGLLGRGPFPRAAAAAMLGVDGDESDRVRVALKTLVQRGLLAIRSGDEDQWQFAHVLAYRFARHLSASDSVVASRLAGWIHQALVHVLRPGSGHARAYLDDLIQHADALLETDTEQRLWEPLGFYLLYEGSNRLYQLGQLGRVALAQGAVTSWLARAPSSATWVHHRMTALHRRYDYLKKIGDLDGALVAARHALDAARDGLRLEPSNTTRQRDLCLGLINLGNVLAARHEYVEALKPFSEVVEIRRRAVAADPTNVLALRDLNVALDRLSTPHMSLNKLDEALALSQESLDGARRLLSADLPLRRSDVAASCNNVGLLLLLKGRLTEALEAYRENVAIRRQEADEDPSNADSQSSLALALINIANALAMTGDLSGAVAAAEESVKINATLVALEPTNADWQRAATTSRDALDKIRAIEPR